MKHKISKTLTAFLAAGLLLSIAPSVQAADTGKQNGQNSVTVKTTTTKQAPTKGQKLAKRSYITVALWPQRRIRIFKQKGDNHFQASKSHLRNGSTKPVYNEKRIGHSAYFYLGKDKWVNGKNVIEYHLKHTRYHVLKANPRSRQYYTSQYFPVFAPWGCASTSLSMLMKFDHTFKDVPGYGTRGKLTYMQNHLPRNIAEGGQDGNPYTGAGFSHVIRSYALMNYAHRLGDKRIKDISGISLNNIKKLVLAGKPVLYYGYSSYDAAGARNHCKVIFGYSKKSNRFLVHDPLYQAGRFYRGGGGRNAYDLGPIAWVKASHIRPEFAYRHGNNALTIK